MIFFQHPSLDMSHDQLFLGHFFENGEGFGWVSMKYERYTGLLNFKASASPARLKLKTMTKRRKGVTFLLYVSKFLFINGAAPIILLVYRIWPH